MKGKRLLIVGAAVTLAISGCASAVRVTRTTPLKTTADGTAATSITSGKQYLVTAVYSNTRYYLTPDSEALTAGNVKATAVSNVSTATAAMCWTFTGSGSSWKIEANGFFLVNSDTNNGVSTDSTAQNWTSSFNGSTLTLTGANSRKLALYQGSNWRCYTSSSGVQALAIYEYATNSNVIATYTSEYGTLSKTTDTVAPGTSITLPTISNKPADYSFGGFSDGTNVYGEGASYTINANTTFTAIWNEIVDAGAVTYDLSEMFETGTWTSTYENHEHTFNVSEDESAVVAIKLANKQSEGQAISGIPVSKGGDITFVLNSETRYIKNITFHAKQWGDKAQTMTLHSSTNSGSSYTSTGITSSNFKIRGEDFEVGTNAIKVTFSSSSNQVGYVSFIVTYEDLPNLEVSVESVSISGINNNSTLDGSADNTIAPNKQIQLSATVNYKQGDGYMNGNGSLSWASSNASVATVSSTGLVTLAGGNGSVTITATSVENDSKSNSLTFTVSNINEQLGSVNNPYTVAQARAAIDAGTGLTGVYATGIVSAIVTPYNSQYGNISYNISDDGSTESEQLEAFRGKRADGSNFTSANDVQVTAIVVVYGNLTKYGDTYEFAADNRLISHHVPGVLETPQPQYSNGKIVWEAIDNAASYDISIDGGDAIHNAVSPYTLGELSSPAVHTAEVTAIGSGSNSDSLPGTVTFAVLTKAGTSEDPYDVANAKVAIDGHANVTGVYVFGKISQVVSYDDEHKSITYWISPDGLTTSAQFEVYSGKDLNGADFSSVNDIEVGASVVVVGDIKAYNGDYEFNYNNHLVSYHGPAHELDYYLDNASPFAELSGQEKRTVGAETTITKAISEVSGTTTNGTQVALLTLDEIITVSVNADGNNGKVYNSGAEWRLYQTNNAVVTVKAANNYLVKSVTFTFVVDNTGTLNANGSAIASESPVAVSGNSVQFVVGNSTSATNGQVKISSISVTYQQSTLDSLENVSMRLGVKFDKKTWDDLADNYTIKDYGVMLFKRLADSQEPTLTVEQAFNQNRALATVRKGSGAAPYLDESSNQYVFNAKVKISSANYGLVFASAAFVVIDDGTEEGDYHFISIDDYSAKDVAEYHLTHGGTDLSEDALRLIING